MPLHPEPMISFGWRQASSEPDPVGQPRSKDGDTEGNQDFLDSGHIMNLAFSRRNAILLTVWLALCGQALGALDVAFTFEVRKTGLDTNAGGFTRGASIAAPGTPSVSNITTGGSVAANTYYFVYTYTDAWGDTVISPQSSTTTTGTTSTITATTPSAATDAKTWNCYVGTTSGGPYFPQGTALTIGSNRTITTTPPTTGTQPRGVDYSVQDSPQVNVADGVANGTTTFTSATAAFTGAHVGNLIRVGTTAWRHIVGVTNATTIVLDATVSTASSLPVVIGGGFLTVGAAAASGPITQSIIFVKYNATAYTYSASQNVAGGGISTGQSLVVAGYNTTRTILNTDALRPTMQPTANSAFFWPSMGTDSLLANMIFSNPGAFTSCQVTNGNNDSNVFHNVKVSQYAIFFGSANGMVVRFCDVSVPTVHALGSGSKIIGTDWHNGGGVQMNAYSAIIGCNFFNINVGTNVIQCNAQSVMVANCSIYNFAYTTGSDISAIQLNKDCTVLNTVVEGVTPTSGHGYVVNSGASAGQLVVSPVINCFYFNVKTGANDPATTTGGQLFSLTALSASAFTNPGSGNLALNGTAGGGAVVRAASLPTTFPAGTTSNYLDAGAAQSQSTSGGGKKVGPGGGKVGLIGPAIRLRKAG